MMADPEPKLLVVAHDAGGAEIISAWLRRHLDEWDAALAVAGPAKAIFARKLDVALPQFDGVPPLEGVSFVLCGSSASAQLERQAVRASRAAGVRCAVWLDHWTNYRARFIADGDVVLPDEVWVSDEYAAAIARAELPGADIRLHHNQYLEDFAGEVRSLDAADAPDRANGGEPERILYVTEPIAASAELATGDPGGWGYNEFDALARYLDHLVRRDGARAELRLRTHPSESPEKYSELLGPTAAVAIQHSPPGATLAEDVAWADTVVGCDTMAMAAALAAGRRVISMLSVGTGGVTLPHAQIERPFRSVG
ncbi:hypothetical protein AYO39_03230 [Actinobacteria bacterium SCGC AG-212-D09]|nr:hypothetical protein AYO39_03230 [Actinobacteria bacterium SCGC AG-212-D09]